MLPQLLTKNFRLLTSKITLLIFLLIIQFYFLINGRAIFPDYWNDTWQTITLIYFASTFLFLAVSTSKARKSVEVPLSTALLHFSLGFLITWGILVALGVSKVVSYPTIPKSQGLFTLLFNVFVVAPSEEIIFRAVVPSLLPFKPEYVNWIISSILFGIFHQAVYGLNLWFIAIAFLISMLWFFVNSKTSLATSIGSHAAYNACVSGAITQLPFLT